MKRYLTLLITLVVFAFILTSCTEEEIVPKEENLQVLTPSSENILEKTHYIEGMEFVTTYDTGDYNLSRWRITDSKVINMFVKVKNVPEGAVILIEHVHIDMSLKSTNPQFDGLSQDNMDDSYHGTSQDGFFISQDYQYENKFAVKGFSKDLIDGWAFVCDFCESRSVYDKRLTEKNLVEFGEVYANKMQVVYDVLIKYQGEDFYHIVSLLDEFLIPVQYEDAD